MLAQVELPGQGQRAFTAVDSLGCPIGEAVEVQQVPQDLRLTHPVPEGLGQLQGPLRERFSLLLVKFCISRAAESALMHQGGEFHSALAALIGQLLHFLVGGQGLVKLGHQLQGTAQVGVKMDQLPGIHFTLLSQF